MFLVGKADRFDLKSPTPVLGRLDTRELRDKIPSLSVSEARKLGIGKSTVHYLKKRVRDRKPFTVYEPVPKKLLN